VNLTGKYNGKEKYITKKCQQDKWLKDKIYKKTRKKGKSDKGGWWCSRLWWVLGMDK